MEEIPKNAYNLNISRYISTAVGKAEIDLDATHGELASWPRLKSPLRRQSKCTMLF